MAPRCTRHWLTVAEAAQHARLSPRTIRKRIASGDLPAYTPRGSRLIRIDKADLDTMVEGAGRTPAGHLRGQA